MVDLLKNIPVLVKTDIPELYKPWACSSELIGTPLFITISRKGVVFLTDDNILGLFYYRQTPIKQKLYTINKGSLNIDKEDPVTSAGVKAKEAKWLSVSGLALIDKYDRNRNTTKFDDLLLVADTSLQSIRCVQDVSLLWKSPTETFHIYTLDINFDTDHNKETFFPFSLKTCLPNEKQFIVTNPVIGKIYIMEISDSYREAMILQTITDEKIARPIDCTFTQGKYYATDKDCVHSIQLLMDGSFTVNSFYFEGMIKFSFGITVLSASCSDDGSEKILVSDLDSHVIFNVTSEAAAQIIAGKHNTPGFDDGPVESALINSPAGINCRGSSLYIAEHPKDHAVSVRVVQCVTGLYKFQSIWHDTSRAFSMISRKESRRQPERGKEVKNISICDAKDKLEDTSHRLQELIGNASTLHGSMQLDITTGCMSGVTAACLYDTLLSGVQFVIDYFTFIGRGELLEKISMGQLSDKLVEGFFGVMTSKNQGNNLGIGDMARRLIVLSSF